MAGLPGARIALPGSWVEAFRRGDGRGRRGLSGANVERVAQFGVEVDSLRVQTDFVGTDLSCGWAAVGARQ